MAPRSFAKDGHPCRMRQYEKRATRMDRPCAGHTALRLRMGTSDCGEMRNKAGGGWKRTGLSKRVLKSRTGRFIMIPAAHSFTRMTRQSLPSKRMTSPAWSRNGCCQERQMMPTNSVCAGSLKHFLVCFIKPPSSGLGGYEHSWD